MKAVASNAQNRTPHPEGGIHWGPFGPSVEKCSKKASSSAGSQRSDDRKHRVVLMREEANREHICGKKDCTAHDPDVTWIQSKPGPHNDQIEPCQRDGAAEPDSRLDALPKESPLEDRDEQYIQASDEGGVGDAGVLKPDSLENVTQTQG